MPSFVDRILGYEEPSILNNPYYAGASLAGAAAAAPLTSSGIRDLNNNNVFISYGTAAPLGGGHKAPASSIKAILEELKTDKDSPSFMKKLKIYDRAMSQDGMTLNNRGDIDFNTRYLLGLDTGWGVLDPERNPEYFFKTEKGSLTDYLNPDIVKRTHKKVIFAPDGRSYSGYQASGDASRISKKKDYTVLGYGDFDPIAAEHIADGRYKKVHEWHPLVGKDLGAVLDKPAYAPVVSNYIKTNTGLDVDPAEIANKKIITVSGATRGDSVGVRTRMVHDYLEKNGLLDNYIILGIAGGNKERESLIAGAGTNGLKNTYVGGGLPGSKAFQEMVNNSDLHFMGMGGATPFEMLSHGGAPIITASDEQVFRAPKGAQRWENARLDPKSGYYSREAELINILKEQAASLPDNNPMKAKLLGIKESDPRQWMNTTLDENDIPIRRGLDGIRDILDNLDVQEVASHSFDDMLGSILNDKNYMDKAVWVDKARVSRESLEDARRSMKSALKKQIVNAKSHIRGRAIAKLLGGTAALVPGIAGLYDAISKKVN